jgi:hypothetical protein
VARPVLFRPGMKDVLYLLLVCGFFGLCWAYTVGTDRL